ncbi:tryptophan 7-halogenase [Myxococcota bacterium]|nr:tryptophan 7-halogenase [Myxococcota bacterium]
MTGRADWDVIVAGAGPGGSSIAAILAMAGKRVLVVERETFPRFHIGESLLPASGLIQSVLGIEPDPADFFFKRGAQFIDESSGRIQTFDFSEALPGPQRFAWHVERARFDKLLRDRAEQVGAVLRHRFEVEDVETDAAGVRVRIRPVGEGTGGETGGERIVEHGRYFIDATGQDRFLARKHGTGRALERFGRAAVFTHFAGLSPAAQAEIAPYNDIRVVIVPDGWLWGIPLTGNRLSVGIVKRTPGLRRSDLDDYLASSPLFGRLLAGAERLQTRMVANFSFENEQASGLRYACVGDSACFIDPVFSSGVSLAILRAIEVSKRLLPALDEKREGDPALMKPMEDATKRAYETFASLVFRFYNTNFIDNMIFGAPDEGRFRAGVISVLAGDVFRDDNPFQDMLLRSRRHAIRTTPDAATGREPVATS